MEEILKKIGQLQFEISCLELDEETLTGVSLRTEELKELVKNCFIPDVENRLSYDELMEKLKNDVAYKWLDEEGRVDFESGVLTGYGLAFK